MDDFKYYSSQAAADLLIRLAASESGQLDLDDNDLYLVDWGLIKSIVQVKRGVVSWR